MTVLVDLQSSQSTPSSIDPSSPIPEHSHPFSTTARLFSEMPSYHKRPRPGQRRAQVSSRPHASLFHPWTIITMILIILSFSSTTSAVVIEAGISRRSLLDQPAQRGEIFVDRLAAPQLPAPRSDLSRRQDQDGNGSPFDGGSPSSTKASASASAAASSSSAAKGSRSTAVAPSASGTGTPTTVVSAPTSLSNSTLPSPFDTSIGSNFSSSSCPDFFDSFLNNATFKSCAPLSLLLQNSNSFFKASRSPAFLTQTLEATCSVNLQTCVDMMSDLASKIIDDACGQDYHNENPIVQQARNGLVAYEPLYRAGCLKNDNTGNFCFADAITNTSSASDAYPYYLPLGIALPAASRPTCNQCLQNTMNIFASAAVDKNQPLAQTYVLAAQQIDLGCGPTFVNSTVPVATVGSSAPRYILSWSSIRLSAVGPRLWLLLA
jgi:hypothetical protein